MKYRLIKILLFSCVILFACDENPSPAADGSELNLTRGVINGEFEGQKFVIYADGLSQTLLAYDRVLDGEILEFTLSNNSASILLDQFENEYDIHGIQISDDPTSKIKLNSINHLVGYWFFFPSFYETVQTSQGSISNPDFLNTSENWLINTDWVFTGSSRDGIPSIDHPSFISPGSKAFIDDPFYSDLDNDELIIAVRVNNETHLYPQRILEYHEVVNDVVGGKPITVSYCPLTGTSKAWSREVKDQNTEFGVSGLLYNNNLILYDRSTESYWSQILEVSIFGDCLEENPTQINLIETSLNKALGLGGNLQFLSTQTGRSYDYQTSIYDDYKSTPRVSFPLSNTNDLIPSKERVIGIISGDNARVFTFDDFEE